MSSGCRTGCDGSTFWAWNRTSSSQTSPASGRTRGTERSLREAIESYRRGVFLAASNLLGAAVEGAWYAAGRPAVK